ncbi:MAG: hypothetical protein N2C12_11585, partial [Planctomycetales bacterium]
FGPKRAGRMGSANDSTAQITDLNSRFRKAQRRVERRHFRGRKSLMYYEKQRKKVQAQMGQDPYLDTTS